MQIRTSSFAQERPSDERKMVYTKLTVSIIVRLENARTRREIKTLRILYRETTRAVRLIRCQLRGRYGYVQTEELLTGIITEINKKNLDLPKVWSDSGMNIGNLLRSFSEKY